MIKLEQALKNEFEHPDPNQKWREGTNKHSFNYLLLDSRITKYIYDEYITNIYVIYVI